MGSPGVPSSSEAEMPMVELRWKAGRRLAWFLGNVLLSMGDPPCDGGEKGPAAVASAFAELARRAFSFSARSARKNMSSGDSSRATLGAGDGWAGVGISASEAGGDGSWLSPPPSCGIGESVLSLAKKLGMGSDEGAGEAWKVAPAKTEAEVGLGPAVCGGERRPVFAGPGEVETFFGRGLLRFFLFDLEGGGLPGADFCGVAGSKGA